ncbi:hypothetical protein PV10_05342 [Exophiala mesophila]|uniref:CUE domain-containing protein n=1 Tax=Exophiala mesophila TaxID=212818 RepID=A0A0D1XRI8_EXOME|nr:uncharacterized protein PV10_05342 [Exophiala mesophila]KIV90716.1 hypothetical protein PV10_05342 [Exophiala mesophila]
MASKRDRTPSPVSPLKPSDAPPESPTTARALDFDSDQETGTIATDKTPNPPPKDEPLPPAKPQRPLSPREQAEQTLREAFPSIDPGVVKAVLSASGGNVEPAFNALLGMTDPDSQREPDPPLQPPRPIRPQQQPHVPGKMSQLESDELYARQLAEHYSGAGSGPRRSGDRYNEHLPGSRPGRPGSNPNPDDVPWRSFIDDDLPEIRDNIRKGFQETQKTVNSWITALKKNFDGEEDDGYRPPQPPRPGQQQAASGFQSTNAYPNRRSADMRRSADLQRYDADPQLIGDDFSKLELRDGEAPPRTSSRPTANPNLFKSGGAGERRPSPGNARKVSFQDGPPEEIKDMYSANSDAAPPYSSVPAAPGSGGKTSKWQPMSKIDPSPVADNDPFSLGDSDEEKDAKPITLKDGDVAAAGADAAGSKKDLDEDERVKKATEDALKESIGADTKS